MLQKSSGKLVTLYVCKTYDNCQSEDFPYPHVPPSFYDFVMIYIFTFKNF